MGRAKAAKKPQTAENYDHSESQSPMRPDVGTQAQFKKKKPPATYRFDSSLAPELQWDGQNAAREQGEALIRQIAEAGSLDAAQAAAEKLKALSRPFLNWSGKAERLSFDVPTLPLFVHERLSTKAIIETLQGHYKPDTQSPSGGMFYQDLFADPRHSIADQVLRAYEHRDRWTNRMILGDSLVVMNSLVHYESLGGAVQMIYMDPPYGVRFGSNFQPFVRRRDVKHNDDADLTREPEMVQAYRDTWELGLHSYLTYLRDRLLVARELLAPSGSLFVQISDENLHHVREVMDEVFGAENFISVITFAKTTTTTGEFLPSTCDFLLWYARDKERMKFRPLFETKTAGMEGATAYTQLQLPDGTRRPMTREEKDDPSRIPPGARPFRIDNLTSPRVRAARTGYYPIEFEGREYLPAKGEWKTHREGIERLRAEKRLAATGDGLYYVRFIDDFPAYPINNIWTDTVVAGFASEKLYVVETNTKAIRRCLLMTTDPGDLVLDPTCVRKGTRVWVVDVPGEEREKEAPPQSPRGRGEGRDSADGRGAVPGSATRRLHSDSSLPPSAGGLRGGCVGSHDALARYLPIDTIQPGQFVLSHDARPHRVRRVIRKPYRGWMVRLQHSGSDMPLWLTADHRVLAKLRPRTLGGNQDWSGSPIESLERRRALRQDMSMPERLLWSVLRGKQNGFKFRRQHPLGPYIVDFYCREAHLVVEVDGGTHYTREAIEYDRRRDRFLRGLGLDVFRIPATEFGDNLEGVAIAVQAQCRLRAESVQDAQWVQAGSLVPGDVVFWMGDEEGNAADSGRNPPLNPPADGGKEEPRSATMDPATMDPATMDPATMANPATMADPATLANPAHVTSAAILAPSPSAGRVGVGGLPLRAVHIDDIQIEWSEEEVYDLEVEGAHSYLTEVCAVHNCGSGTTAYVAEQWGRRWITIDVSRVPLALARQRLLTATFPWYELADEPRGPAGGFVYRRKQNAKGEETGGIVPHVTLKSIANNEPPAEEVLVDRPETTSGITRVTGPFTFEATIPTPVDWEGDGQEDSGAVTAESQASFTDRMLEVLRKSPVLRLEGNKTVTFKNVRPPAKTLSLSAEALVVNQSRDRERAVKRNGGAAQPVADAPGSDGVPVAFVFGPENGAVSEKLAHEALREAHLKSYSHLYVIGFAIQPNARSLIDNSAQMGTLPATYVQATPDLLMGDLLKNMRSSQIFSVCGLPEIELIKLKSKGKNGKGKNGKNGNGDAKYQVRLLGLDVFDPITMDLEHKPGSDVPTWLLDTDYNDLCFHVCQAFFPRTAAWDNLKKALKGTYEESVWDHLAGDTSAPFSAGEHGQIAVKVIDDRGNELLVVKRLEEAKEK